MNAAANASASGIGTLIGQATAANLAAWKVGVLSDGSVTAAMLADGAVTTPKLANSAVTTAKIADGAVGSLQIADATITNEEIANKTIIANQKLKDGSIEEAQYGTGSVSTRALQVNSVNTPAIKDGSVTGAKIAEGAISGIKIEDGSIPESKITAPGVLYLEPTTVVPNAILSNYKLNIIRVGNIAPSHVNAVMPAQQLPGTPVRIFIEHIFVDNAVMDIRLSTSGAVVGTINISSSLSGIYAEIFVYDGRVFYWTSGYGNYQKK